MGSIRSALDTVRFIQKESCLGIYQTTSTLPKKDRKVSTYQCCLCEWIKNKSLKNKMIYYILI